MPANFRQMAAMEKSLFTNEYGILLEVLREIRQKAGLTQIELGERIGANQVFISRCESGQTRLDMIQMRTICQALGTSLPAFVRKLESRLAEANKKSRQRAASVIT